MSIIYSKIKKLNNLVGDSQTNFSQCFRNKGVLLQFQPTITVIDC
ncbi:Uncharacterised protein [Streptococcus pneumoniae]|nr:Uncharacterised protein [Streptococcus pneumoniae]